MVFSAALTGPNTGLSSHRQTTPISTPGMMYGRKSPTRKKDAQRNFIC